MKQALATNDKAPFGHNFPCYYARISQSRFFYVPVVSPMTSWQIDRKTTLEQRRRLYKHLVEWWEQHKTDTYWDDDIQKLVAKGQTPKEIRRAAAAEAAAREEAEKQAILSEPLSEEQIAELRDNLIEQFEKQHSRDAASAAKRLGEKGKHVRWKKEGGNRWVYEHPTAVIPPRTKSPPTIWTFTGPTMSKTSDKEKPLRAVFAVRVLIPSSKKPSKQTEEYIYDRLKGHWRPAELTGDRDSGRRPNR